MSQEGKIGLVDALVLGGIAALPWFWGGTDLASTRFVAALLLAAGASLAVFESTRAMFPRQSRSLWLPALVLAGFGALQATPLPEALVARLSPEAYRHARASFPVPGAQGSAWLAALEEKARTAVPEAAAAVPPATPARPEEPAPAAPRWLTVSLSPDATRELTFWFIALLVAFAVVSRRCRDAERAEVYQGAMFFLFTALAIVSLANRLSAPSTILWLAPASPDAKPFGPYVNATHFAGAMELGIPWMLGYALSRVTRSGWRRSVSATTVLAIAGSCVGLVAAILAASKTAALLLFASCAIVLVRSARRHRSLRLPLALAGVAAAAVIGVASSGYLGERVAEYRDIYLGAAMTNDRLVVWKAALPMAADYWAVGSGMGAFADVFPAYQPAGESGIWGEAHSDWLELVLGGGVVGVALTLTLAAAYARRLGASVRRASSDRGAVLGAALGVGSLTLHALVDFNHQIPANALLFVATAAWAASREDGREETEA